MERTTVPRTTRPAGRREPRPPADALVLMGKAPVPGTVKTRLCPPLSPASAASLAGRMLEDTARELSRLRGVERYLSFWPAGEFRRLSPGFCGAFRPVPQRGAGLGERMANAFRDAAARGHRNLVLVGSDCPALAAARVRAAFRELRDGAFAVLGPSTDGGFYLVGLSEPAPVLFRGVAWSGPRVLSQVIGALRREGRPFSLLPPESDVDTPADLAALRAWARERASPACPRTRAWLRMTGRGRPTVRRAAERTGGRSRGRRSRSGSSPP